jgi:ABC-type lipoprotein release transport system permease subunit
MKLPVSYSMRNMWTRRLTTLLTMGGIMLVVFVFAAILMLSNGLRRALVATGCEDNVMIVRKGSTAEIMSTIDRDQVGILESMPEFARTQDGKALTSSEVCVIINLNKRGSDDMGNVVVRGVSPNALALRPQVRLAQGRYFRSGTSEIVTGSSIAGRFQGAQIGDNVRFANRDWTVVGVIESGGSGFDSEIWCDAEQVLQVFRRPVFSVLTARLSRMSDTTSVIERIKADPRLSQLEVKNERRFYAEQSEMMSMFISIIGIAITLIFSFGAMVGAMITMYAAVANRTTEIGTLRALGFPRKSIMAAFLIEAQLIALLGGVLGLLLASGLQLITVSTTNWTTFSEIAFGFALSPDIVVSCIVFSLVMGFVGGFLPAFRASRMDILDALRA